MTTVVSQDGLVVACTDNTDGHEYAMRMEAQPHEMDMDTIVQTGITNHPLNQKQKDLHFRRLNDRFNEEGKECVVMDLFGPNLERLDIQGVSYYRDGKSFQKDHDPS